MQLTDMERIQSYFDDLQLSEMLKKKNIENFRRHPDIAREFVLWMQTGVYVLDHPVEVEGYTAADICRLAPFLDGPGAFNFLITLRERPAKGLAYIASGFRRK